MVPEKLAGTVVGGINHSRWLTLAIRLEQLYTKTASPSPGLCKVVKFIVEVYAPSWFQISSEALDEACLTPVTFPPFPCHSQSVERAVKLVTEAASKVCGEDKRHTHILSVNACRKARKPFKSKKHYKYSDV